MKQKIFIGVVFLMLSSLALANYPAIPTTIICNGTTGTCQLPAGFVVSSMQGAPAGDFKVSFTAIRAASATKHGKPNAYHDKLHLQYRNVPHSNIAVDIDTVEDLAAKADYYSPTRMWEQYKPPAFEKQGYMYCYSLLNPSVCTLINPMA